MESGGLVDLLQGEETSRQAHGVERAGRLGPHEVVIVESGVGVRAAERATSAAIAFYRPRWVISTGFAGALAPELRKGHIVMADEVTDPTGERLATGLKLDPQTVAATRGLHVGRLLTVGQIIRRPEDRRRLAVEHGAIACDMETIGVARACREQGTRFVAVRVITDTLDDELPPEIEALLAQKSLAGKLGAAAGAVFRRPSAVKDLWQLREDGLKASDRLAKFLTGVVQQLASQS
jgi:adenosylhomocysteine nucleosidase